MKTAKCHPEKRSKARGLCSTCYTQRYHANTLPTTTADLAAVKEQLYLDVMSNVDPSRRMEILELIQLLSGGCA